MNASNHSPLRLNSSPARVALAVLLVSLVHPACSSGDSENEPDSNPGNGAAGAGATNPPTLSGACSMEERFGTFQVAMEARFSSVSGSVSNGVVPTTVLRKEVEEGECQLLRQLNPLCDPACESNETCDLDGQCVPFPEPQSVGTVEISGLEKAVKMDPLQPGNTYTDTTLPQPGFRPGAEIVLTAAGQDVPGFTLHGVGVEPLELTTESLRLERGTPFELKWVEAEGPASIRFTLKIDLHGITPVRLQCQGPDDGSLTVPVTLVDQLMDFGVSGFPAADLYRETVDSVEHENGCVQMSVFSHVAKTADVEGHVPCRTSLECTAGQTCDLATESCV